MLLCYYQNKAGRSSLVNIVTRLPAGWPEIQILIGVRDFSLLYNVQTGSDAQQVSYSVGTRVVSWDYSCWGR